MNFTLRDLFWLTVVVALVLGWLADRQVLIATQEAQNTALVVEVHALKTRLVQSQLTIEAMQQRR